MKMRFACRGLMALFFVMICTSCATLDFKRRLYEGDQLPESEVSRVRFGTGIHLLKLDQKELKKSANRGEYELLPGEHSVVAFTYVWTPYSDNQHAVVTTGPGRVYVIGHDRELRRIWIAEVLPNLEFKCTKCSHLNRIGDYGQRKQYQVTCSNCKNTFFADHKTIPDSAVWFHSVSECDHSL